MLVMMPMLRRPPERPLLRRRAAKEGETKLEESTRLVTPMGKITMKPAGDAKLADQEHESAERHGIEIDSRPKHAETCQMNQDKKNAGKSDIKAARHTGFVLFRNPHEVRLKAPLPTVPMPSSMIQLRAGFAPAQWGEHPILHEEGGACLQPPDYVQGYLLPGLPR
jgi:hypothetical protein